MLKYTHHYFTNTKLNFTTYLLIYVLVTVTTRSQLRDICQLHLHASLLTRRFNYWNQRRPITLKITITRFGFVLWVRAKFTRFSRRALVTESYPQAVRLIDGLRQNWADGRARRGFRQEILEGEIKVAAS